MGKYDPLGRALRAAAERGQDVVDLDFEQVAALVGGLPASAYTYPTWWANNSHSHALAWRDAGYHVQSFSLDRQRVRFARGQVGGSRHDRLANAAAVPARAAHPPADGRLPLRPLDCPPVDVTVMLRWLASADVVLDQGGKPHFGELPAVPGLYRMTFRPLFDVGRTRRYVGQTDNLRRRLNANYRSPGPRQRTSLRLNAALRAHLGEGGAVEIAVATEAVVSVSGSQSALDLRLRSSRMLAESAAVVAALAAGDCELLNLGDTPADDD